MKHTFLFAILLLALGACQKEPEEIIEPEYKDWYMLKAPDGRAIQAVYGDIDGPLIITTGFEIYQTKDRGKTWRTAIYPSNLGLTGFIRQQDTLLALNAQRGTAFDSTTAHAVNPGYFSLDEGATWRPIRNAAYSQSRVAINRVMSTSGTEYSIDYFLTPISPNSSSSYVETVGIKTATGRVLTLPQDHQINSLYLDTKSRLYVAGSAALCGRRDKFAYCGLPNGILYVSKIPQP